MDTIHWYSINESLAIQDGDAVTCDEALAIVRRYCRDLQPYYSSGEEACAATTFGFARSSIEFIEISLHTPGLISVWIELPVSGVPWFLRPWWGFFRHEEEVYSPSVLEDRVRQFFTLPADQLRKCLLTKR